MKACDGGPYCANRFHDHGERKGEQMPNGMWKWCRHWCPGMPWETLGPHPHYHTDQPEFADWFAKEQKKRRLTTPPPRSPR